MVVRACLKGRCNATNNIQFWLLLHFRTDANQQYPVIPTFALQDWYQTAGKRFHLTAHLTIHTTWLGHKYNCCCWSYSVVFTQLSDLINHVEGLFPMNTFVIDGCQRVSCIEPVLLVWSQQHTAAGASLLELVLWRSGQCWFPCLVRFSVLTPPALA